MILTGYFIFVIFRISEIFGFDFIMTDSKWVIGGI